MTFGISRCFWNPWCIGGGYQIALPTAISLLCWICRGLGNPRTVQELSDLVRVQDPAVVFLVETWLEEARLDSIRDKLQMGHKFGVSRIHWGGGLALFWKQDIDLKVVNSSPNFIDAIFNVGKENSWRFTGFYGALETQNHHRSWSCLQQLFPKFSLPWIYASDFNEIIRSHGLGEGWDQQIDARILRCAWWVRLRRSWIHGK